MNRSIDRFTAAMFIAALFSIPPLQAQGEKEPSAEEKAMMEAWAKASTPNENHERLARFVGTWEFTTKWWVDPAAEPRVSRGTATYEMVMGGRYLKEMVLSRMMDGTFQGLGITGYDNVKQGYVSAWVDNMGTGIMVSEGSWDEAARAYNWTGKYTDPMTGKTGTMRMVNRIIGDNRFVAEFFDRGPDGKEFRSMEITYTRK